MQNILEEAVKTYLESIEVDFNVCKTLPKKGFVSEINIKGDKNYDVFIIVPLMKLDYIANLWFGDSEDYDKEDLIKEIANLIVGNAKVIAENKGIKFDISIPKFLGEFEDFKNLEYDDILKFKFKNRCFFVMFKEK